MKTDYHERREARIDRLRDRADKHKAEGESKMESGRKMLHAIPFGQPILVGHHSEKADRNYRNRAGNRMDRGMEQIQYAGELAQRAGAAESNTAISSDNPDALELLREKLAGMEAERAAYKATNKIAKKKGATPATIAAGLNISEGAAAKLLEPNWAGKVGIESYVFSNLSGNMRRVKQRITSLEALEGRENVEHKVGEVRILENVEGNRVQVFFPGKPSEVIRGRLKINGFRWSPTEEAWQKNFSDWAVTQAKQILEERVGS